MKKLIYSLLITAIAVLTSCKDEIAINIEEPINSHISENKYAISEETALVYLADFLNDSEPESRSGKQPKISSIKPIKYNRVASRAQQDNIDCENLLYVANFEDNQGYAILAGDERISDKIIAVADSGNLENDELYADLNKDKTTRYRYKGYPIIGPGFFTTPETDDELFMNPNTVNLYVDSISDTLVGNFFVDGLEVLDENGNIVTPDSVSIPNSLCIEFAKKEVGLESPNPDDNFWSIDGRSDNTDDDTRTEVKTSGWTLKSRVLPMLKKYVEWNQRSPFNDLYPYRRDFLCFGSKSKAPAGCFPLAIAKLLSYYQCPQILKYNGYTINWYELNSNYNSIEGSKSAAHLLKAISDKSDSWYFKQGTFTFPGKASNAMKFFGLDNAKTYRYSWERALTMLDNGCPFIIYAIPGTSIHKSHAWNIDGYKIKERIVTFNTYKNGTLTNKRTETETLKMVHCDFGAGGKGNGYYVSGIFNQNGTSYELDAGQERGNTDYDNYIHLIMYDKPYFF